MTYQQIKNLKEQEFKRLCGVKPKLFQEMVAVLKQNLPQSRQRGGQAKLSWEDQLLITLEYWREYRTYFHIAQSWGVHESTVCRIVHRVEDKLIKSKRFSLPEKKVLAYQEREWSAIIVDVGESPIERPKKSAPPAPRFPRRKDGASIESLLQWQEKKTCSQVPSSY